MEPHVAASPDTATAKPNDSNTPELTNENSDTFGFPLDKNGNQCESYFNTTISANFAATDSIDIYGGVRNLFDEDPCNLTQITKYGNTGTNTAAELYDVTGTDFWLGLTARF